MLKYSEWLVVLGSGEKIEFEAGDPGTSACGENGNQLVSTKKV